MLTVDLSRRVFRIEEMPGDLLRTCLGGRGMGVELMKEHITLDPYDPDMPLVFAVGPLCGTPAPTSARMSVVSRSPLTGTIFDSSVGHAFAYKLKSAGYDCLRVIGRASSPVYIDIREDSVEFRDASGLWGRGCMETDRSISGDGASAVIGPAGERLVRFANIMVGGSNAVGRGGIGGVMGSKKLKAVVVNGSRKAVVADPDAFKKAYEDVMRLLRASPIVMGDLGISEYGTAALVDIVAQRRMSPTENFRKTFFPSASAYSGPSLRRRLGQKRHGCVVCPIQCKKTTSCNKPMPEYETLSHFGALNANSDVESIVSANLMCNDLGMDTISTAATIAAFGEVRGSFLLPDEILNMIRKIAYRQGEGDLLAEGSLRYCRSIGRPEVSMSVKGLELPAYDPRGSYGMALAYVTSQRGGCHLRAYPISQEILRRPVATDRFSFDGKARLIKISEDANAVVDSLAVCKFAFLGASLEEYGQMLAAATGLEYTGQGLMKLGEGIVRMERAYNAMNGFGRDSDILPERFYLESGSSGDGIDIPAIDRNRFMEELEKYYRIRDARIE